MISRLSIPAELAEYPAVVSRFCTIVIREYPNRTRQIFTCTSKLNMNVRVVNGETEKVEWLHCDVTYKYNMIY